MISFNFLTATPPSDILHDTAFQFLVIFVATLIAAGISGGISYWIYRKQHTRKELSYQIISDASIVSIDDELKDKIAILFEGTHLNNMRLLVLKIWNSGNIAIKRDDYDEPISIAFKGGKI